MPARLRSQNNVASSGEVAPERPSAA